MSLVSKALKGKTVLVTGASKGIGKALCKNLVEVQGCKVIGTGRNKEKLEKVGKELGIKIIEADLSKPEDCDRVA
jgi:short-subunit dehydrogenase